MWVILIALNSIASALLVNQAGMTVRHAPAALAKTTPGGYIFLALGLIALINCLYILFKELK